MVQVFRPNRSQKSKQPKHLKDIEIQDLDHEAQGVAKAHQPILFVQGALPNERCNVQINELKKSVWKGQATKVLRASPLRQEAFCSSFAECGGCQTQYVSSSDMLEMKQSAIAHLIQKSMGDFAATIPWQGPLTDDDKGYRRKARLAVDARNPKQLKVGFRGKSSNNVVNITECPVLRPELQGLIPGLQKAINRLNSARGIGHIDLLQGVGQPLVSVRVTRPLSQSDTRQLVDFAKEHQCELLVESESGKYESLTEGPLTIGYPLPGNVAIYAYPNDFIQVNEAINEQAVTQALDWLQLNKDDQVLDLYCGLGNFSLPVSKNCRKVLGIEGVPEMVQRATSNAQKNGIDNVEFVCHDLNTDNWLQHADTKGINKVILDPARAGAGVAMQSIVELNPEIVLYVSCNPVTFGRDIAGLIKQKYKLEKISLLDMFPYTAHSELMAVLHKAN